MSTTVFFLRSAWASEVIVVHMTFRIVLAISVARTEIVLAIH